MSEIDTHVHLLVSKSAPPDWEEISFTIDVAVAEGLHILCISEHLDSQYYPELLEGIFTDGILGGVTLGAGIIRLENGLVLSSAAEVALSGGGDIGVHASPGLLMSLRRNKGHYTLEALLQELELSGESVVTVAHHVYWPNKWIAALPEHASRLDALELPAKDLANYQRYVDLGAQLNLVLMGGGDAHAWPQIGASRSRLQLDDDIDFNREVLKVALRERHLSVTYAQDASRRVKLAGMLRRKLETRITIAF